MKRKQLLILLFLFTAPILSEAQEISKQLDLSDTTQTHFIETLRGDRLIGKITQLKDSNIIFQKSQRFNINFHFSELKRIGVLGIDDVEGVVVLEESRGIENLLYHPTAFPIGQGEGEYRIIDGLWNTVEIGITNNFSVTAGAVIPFVVILRTKIAGRVSDNVHLGLGGTGFIGFEDNEESLYHIYGIVTLGEENKHFNLTGGFLVSEDFENTIIPAFSLGGAFLFGNYSRIYFDVLLTSGEDDFFIVPTIQYGVIKNQNKFDIGFGILPETDIPLFPFLSYTRLF